MNDKTETALLRSDDATSFGPTGTDERARILAALATLDPDLHCAGFGQGQRDTLPGGPYHQPLYLLASRPSADANELAGDVLRCMRFFEQHCCLDDRARFSSYVMKGHIERSLSPPRHIWNGVTIAAAVLAGIKVTPHWRPARPSLNADLGLRLLTLPDRLIASRPALACSTVAFQHMGGPK